MYKLGQIMSYAAAIIIFGLTALHLTKAIDDKTAAPIFIIAFIIAVVGRIICAANKQK